MNASGLTGTAPLTCGKLKCNNIYTPAYTDLKATVGATGFSLYDYNNSSMMDYYSNMIVANQSFVANAGLSVAGGVAMSDSSGNFSLSLDSNTGVDINSTSSTTGICLNAPITSIYAIDRTVAIGPQTVASLTVGRTG